MTRWVPPRSEGRDRYARLRDDLVVFRTMTTARTSIAWCRACESHQADDTGLCPLCRPEELEVA